MKSLNFSRSNESHSQVAINTLLLRSFELYKVVLTLSLWMKSSTLTVQMKAIHKQYFPVVPLIVLCKVVLTFESVDEILKCDHPNESY